MSLCLLSSLAVMHLRPLALMQQKLILQEMVRQGWVASLFVFNNVILLR